MMISPTELIFLVTSLVLMTLCALWAVLATDLLKAALALAVVSMFLAIVIFLLGAPYAAIFELSVCAGLITVIFVSAISMVKPEGNTRQEEMAIQTQRRFGKYAQLPVLLLFTAILLYVCRFDFTAIPAVAPTKLSFYEVMWDERRVDLLGQVIMILVGVFGVVVLFKEFIEGKE